MQTGTPKQSTFQIHPSSDQLIQFSSQIGEIAAQLIDPKAVVLLREKASSPARVRANVKSRQLLTAQEKLKEVLAILQQL